MLSESKNLRSRGFTMIELMVVITIILILMGIAAGNYQRSVLRSKEAALRQDLFVMRQAIEQYTLDKQQAPQSLEDLVSAGYLRGIPKDPITGRADWRLEFDSSTVLSPDQVGGGLINVRSNSDQVSPFEGTAYSSWD